MSLDPPAVRASRQDRLRTSTNKSSKSAGSVAAETVVIAIGGNALTRHGQSGTFEEQMRNAHAFAGVVAHLIDGGCRIVLTHGNGPQVGSLAIQQEEAERLVPAQPLSVVGAMTQGQIGHVLTLALADAISDRRHPPICVVTHTIVDAADPAFSDPTKPVGPFFSEQRAKALASRRGWTVAYDAGRGWRRVVPSPEPRHMLEAPAIRELVDGGFLVVASGGGGIPIVETTQGLRGVDAVIDKDLSAAILAASTGASTLVMLTDVDRVRLDFGTPKERPLDTLTVAEADAYLAEGQFPAGSMGPKISAAIGFVQKGGRLAVITSPELAEAALRDGGGTHIVADDDAGEEAR